MSGPTPVTRKRVLDRDEHRCQWCGRGIWGADYSLQHRRARGMGGSKRPDTNSPQNLVLLDGSGTTGCHGYIESHREEARLRGFTLMQGQNPRVVPVVDADGLVWLLDDVGGRTERVVSW